MARIRMQGVTSDSLIPTPPSGKASLYYNITDRVYKAKLDDGTVIVLSVSQELVEDVVGNLFQDSSTVNVIYNDAGNALSVEVIQSALDLSQIPNVPSGNLAATNAQAALNELQSDVDTRVVKNAPIVGNTKTKITYDSKGLVTGGTDAVLDDLADVAISDPQLNEVLKYNGVAWVNQNVDTKVNAGAGITYFLSDTNSAVPTYDLMSKTPVNEPEVDKSVTITNTSALIQSFISDNEIGTNSIDAGIWEFNYFTYVSANTGVTFIRTQFYKRTSGGVETLLFSVDSDEINHTTVQALPNVSVVQSAFICNPTDKLVLKVIAVTDSPTPVTVHLVHSGEEHYSHFHTPLITRHNDLVGIQGGSANEYYHLTQAQTSGLTGGNNTNLHYHDSDRDRANHTGTQLASLFLTLQKQRKTQLAQL